MRGRSGSLAPGNFPAVRGVPPSSSMAGALLTEARDAIKIFVNLNGGAA